MNQVQTRANDQHRVEDDPGAEEIDSFWLTDISDLDEKRLSRSETIDDSTQMYLREIGQVSLLSAEEEITLANDIRAGREAQERLKSHRFESLAERLLLERRVMQAEEARRRLIQANLRLVVSIAKKYIGGPLSFMDLVQEGNIGLMRAVEKFDAGKGNRFSTYATWWIRQAITRAIAEQSRLIRLPVHLSDVIAQLRRVARRLEQSLEREPTVEEIAAAIDMPEHKVKLLLQASAQPISLEQPITSDGEGQISELLADDDADAPMEIATWRMLQHDLAQALMELPDRERAVLQLRYGLTDGRRRTLEEVGSAFGITRERTRQIEADALRQLRRPGIGARLQAYLE
ncbi:MAG: sigma-70 family RNA polymerase sigma factor [Roseiflexus sp.]|uniref:sigma-70 family RNA polymerase sigma factor n=1 Tax=Roseiflexus sp. TaxID=2562120 RepID=UPI0025E1B13C|nr:sigma-70 family RNA polymerase sigma factor [Roseiflexus sp.]MCL6543454.1 sigma-70 family RNA polymerase sigma factor [Roseiflexus sp.]